MLKVKISVKSYVVSECTNYKVGRNWIAEYGMTPNDYFCAGVWPRIVHAMEIMLHSPNIEVMDVPCGDSDKIMIYEVRRIIPKKEDDLKGNRDVAS